MGERRVKPKNRKPTFFWQGVLILAPMLVLAKLGALALWQDKRMAQHEAILRAQDAAEESAQLIWNDLQAFGDPPTAPASPQSPRPAGSTARRIQAVNSVARFSASQNYYYNGQTKRIDIDRAGHLVFPPPYDAAPAPQPLNPRALSDAQRGAWDNARAQEANAGVEVLLRAATASYRQFLVSSPPTNFVAAAHFALGNLLAQAKEFAPAIAEFSVLTNRFPNSVSEAGLPLDTLARFKIFEAQRRSGMLRHEDEVRNASDDLLRHVIKNPSALTPEILRRTPSITNEAPESGVMINGRFVPWIPEDLRFQADAEWKEQEQLRQIYRAARPMLGVQSDDKSTGATNTFPFALSARSGATSLLWFAPDKDALAANLSFAWVNSPPKEESTAENGVPARPLLVRSGTNLGWQEGNLVKMFPAPAGVDASINERWLLVRMPTESGATLLCRSGATVREIIDAALKRVRLPQYLDASVRIADIDLISSNLLRVLVRGGGSKGAGLHWRWDHPKEPPTVLGASTRNEGGRVLLAVNIHLISPELLYAQQEERATLFRLLIGASAIASIVGFFTAWRAFHKQLRLAEMKSNFVSSVSHELRAPIASVRLMAEGLERGKISEPAKQQEYFRFITQECRRLSSMIENVLDFARIEQGRKQYEFEPTDVAALVEKTVSLMEPYAAERGVRLALSVPPASCRVDEPDHAETRQDAEGTFAATIDGQAVQQALVNLIDNAVKHSPAGNEVVVELALNPQRSTLDLSVADHGPGIPSSEHEKIFERFYRLGSELRRETPGVGIGLSIVKHVVEAHGGRVRVESEVGEGSRFTIELPFAVGQVSSLSHTILSDGETGQTPVLRRKP
jgi:signal transduction histidine kinase